MHILYRHITWHSLPPPGNGLDRSNTPIQNTNYQHLLILNTLEGYNRIHKSIGSPMLSRPRNPPPKMFQPSGSFLLTHLGNKQVVHWVI